MEKFGDLNGGDADAGAGAKDENGLAGANGGAPHKHVPRGDEYQRDTGSLNEIERIGYGDYVRGKGGDEIAVSAVDSVTEDRKFAALILQAGDAFGTLSAGVNGREQDALAHFEAAHIFAKLDDFSGNVAAGNVRKLHSGQAFAHPNVEVIERARPDADQDVILAQGGSSTSSYFKTSGPPN